MARYYHEPQEFRYALGAFLQAARAVTFMLQKEKVAFSDFKWYETWQEQAKGDQILKWVKDTRTEIVHQQSLEPHSWMKMRCLGEQPKPHMFDEDEEDGPLQFTVSPFECTHQYIERGFSTDHAHEFERYWGIHSLPGRELLEACAEVYDRLEDLIREAHHRAGAQISSHRKDGAKRALPCMEDILKHRIVRTVVKDGREVWEDEPPGLHKH